VIQTLFFLPKLSSFHIFDILPVIRCDEASLFNLAQSFYALAIHVSRITLVPGGFVAWLPPSIAHCHGSYLPLRVFVMQRFTVVFPLPMQSLLDDLL
jgi:hypothetical protein